jgi:hypothetical protein
VSRHGGGGIRFERQQAQYVRKLKLEEIEKMIEKLMMARGVVSDVKYDEATKRFDPPGDQG